LEIEERGRPQLGRAGEVGGVSVGGKSWGGHKRSGTLHCETQEEAARYFLGIEKGK